MTSPMLRSTAALAVALVASAGLSAQTTPLGITGGTYVETFDSMGTGATGVYPTGWNGFKFSGSGALPAGSFITASSNPAFTTSDGSSATGTVFNYGTTGDADRALGSLASTGTVPGFGVILINNTGRTLTEADVQISFRAEQWRTGNSNTVNEVWQFEYRVGDNTLDLNDTTRTTWTPVSALNMNEILTGSTTSGAVNGNTTFTDVGPASLTSLVWLPGQRLLMRWLDTDNSGTDAGMAVDNFTFTLSPVPEPATPLLCGAALAGFVACRRLRRTA